MEIQAYSVSEKIISKASYNTQIKIYPPAKGSDNEDLADEEFKLNGSSETNKSKRNSKQRAMIHSMKVSMEVDSVKEIDWTSFVVLGTYFNSFSRDTLLTRVTRQPCLREVLTLTLQSYKRRGPEVS